MITLTPTNSYPATAEYLHTKHQFNTVKSLSIDPSACCFGDCQMPLPVFADLDNVSNTRNNDFSKWIFEVPTGSSVVCTLTNLNTSTDYVITDTTYGLFTDVGDIADRPLVWCFILQWQKVADLISFGDYRINITIINESDTELFNQNSPCYRLQPFSCESAHNTIRLQVMQEGYNQSGFDWRGLTGLYNLLKPQQIRLWGSIDKTPITTTDFIPNSSRADSHVQTEIHHEYELRLFYIDGSTYDGLVKNLLLEAVINVNSYGVFDSSIVNELQTTFLSVDKEAKDSNNKQERITVKLTDYKKDNLKRY